MTGTVSDAMIERLGELLRRGEIPDEVTLETLWVGMIASSKAEAHRQKAIDQLKLSVGVVAGTLVVYGGVLTLFAAALLQHIQK